jgi:hypothetical protein
MHKIFPENQERGIFAETSVQESQPSFAATLGEFSHRVYPGKFPLFASELLDNRDHSIIFYEFFHQPGPRRYLTF